MILSDCLPSCLWGGSKAEQRYHRKESFCLLISATSFTARLQKQTHLSPDVYASNTVGQIYRELISSDLAGALTLLLFKFYDTWDQSFIRPKISRSVSIGEAGEEGGDELALSTSPKKA